MLHQHAAAATRCRISTLRIGDRTPFGSFESFKSLEAFEVMAFDLTVNRTLHHVDGDPQTPLLWVIRDLIGLTGTKFSCGIGQCGACTVHVDGRAIRSCSAPASVAIGKPVLTIEGLSADGTHPIQMAWK